MFGSDYYYGPPDPAEFDLMSTMLRECEYWGDWDVPLLPEEEEIIDAIL